MASWHKKSINVNRKYIGFISPLPNRYPTDRVFYNFLKDRIMNNIFTKCAHDSQHISYISLVHCISLTDCSLLCFTHYKLVIDIGFIISFINALSHILVFWTFLHEYHFTDIKTQNWYKSREIFWPYNKLWYLQIVRYYNNGIY